MNVSHSIYLIALLMYLLLKIEYNEIYFKRSFIFAEDFCKLLGYQLKKQIGTHSYFNRRGTNLQMKNTDNGFVGWVWEFSKNIPDLVLPGRCLL